MKNQPRKNYTRPNKKSDSNKDRLYTSLVFAQALALMLKETTGVVVEVKGDALNINDWKKVLVYNMNNQITICDWSDKPETHGSGVRFVDNLK